MGISWICVGSVVFSVVASAQVCHFGGNELIEVMTTPQATVYCWVIIFGGAVFAWRFEKARPIVQQHPVAAVDAELDPDGNAAANVDNVEADTVEEQPINKQEDTADLEAKRCVEDEIEPRTLLRAPFIYPASLGAAEAAGALSIKAVNWLLTVIATDKDENSGANTEDNNEDNIEDVGLWVGLVAFGVVRFSALSCGASSINASKSLAPFRSCLGCSPWPSWWAALPSFKTTTLWK